MDKVLFERKKKEARSLLRNCFCDTIYGLVPFDIWVIIIYFVMDYRSTEVIRKLCWGFKQVVDAASLDIACSFRKQHQIGNAKRYLLRSAYIDKNPKAMFHLGFACRYSGWGIQTIDNNNHEPLFYEAAVKYGNPESITFLGFLQRRGRILSKDINEINWKEKACSILNTMDKNSEYMSLIFGLWCYDEENYAQAIYYFRNSVECGSSLGYIFLAYSLGKISSDYITLDKIIYTGEIQGTTYVHMSLFSNDFSRK